MNAEASIDKSAAVAKFEKLVEAISSIGLQTEVRNGENHSVLLFVRVASDDHLFGEVYRSRYDRPLSHSQTTLMIQ
jgi:anoctamin-10